jgi:hypothetical protein
VRAADEAQAVAVIEFLHHVRAEEEAGAAGREAPLRAASPEDDNGSSGMGTGAPGKGIDSPSIGTPGNSVTRDEPDPQRETAAA